MKTQYYTAVSLDGFIADPQHSLDWLFQFDAEGGTYAEFIRDVGAAAMGSTTYEWVLDHLEPGPDGKLPWPYDQPAWVFSSRSHEGIPGADIRFVRGDVRPVHREMVEAAEGRNIWLAGGGDLVGQFHDAGLLDEVIVQVTPVTLGGGAPLLPRRIAEPPMRLTSVERFGDAFVELRYAVTRGEEGAGRGGAR